MSRQEHGPIFSTGRRDSLEKRGRAFSERKVCCRLWGGERAPGHLAPQQVPLRRTPALLRQASASPTAQARPGAGLGPAEGASELQLCPKGPAGPACGDVAATPGAFPLLRASPACP